MENNENTDKLEDVLWTTKEMAIRLSMTPKALLAARRRDANLPPAFAVHNGPNAKLKWSRNAYLDWLRKRVNTADSAA